jgi:hypothetical protein
VDVKPRANVDGQLHLQRHCQLSNWLWIVECKESEHGIVYVPRLSRTTREGL